MTSFCQSTKAFGRAAPPGGAGRPRSRRAQPSPWIGRGDARCCPSAPAGTRPRRAGSAHRARRPHRPRHRRRARRRVDTRRGRRRRSARARPAAPGRNACSRLVPDELAARLREQVHARREAAGHEHQVARLDLRAASPRRAVNRASRTVRRAAVRWCRPPSLPSAPGIPRARGCAAAGRRARARISAMQAMNTPACVQLERRAIGLIACRDQHDAREPGSTP